jgi:hypothetical protein
LGPEQTRRFVEEELARWTFNLSEAAPFTTKLEKLPKARVNGSAYTG